MTTTKHATTDCLPTEVLAEYFLEFTSETRLAEIEEHLADCPDCIEVGRSLRRWNTSIDRWIESAHSTARERVPAAAALLQRDIVIDWSRQLEGLVQGAVVVVTKAKGRATQLITDFVEPLLAPQAAWRFAPVACAARGSETGATDHVKVDDASMPLEITVSGENEITVFLRRLPDAVAAPWVTLYADEDGSLRKIETRQLERGPGEVDYYLAKFATPNGGARYLVTLQRDAS